MFARPLPADEPTPTRLVAIDRVKACAILAVVVTHAGRFTLGAEDPVDFWARQSWTIFDVPAFLVVSGMLLQRPGALPWRPIAVRLQRIYVPYLVAMAVLFALGRVSFPRWSTLASDLALGTSYGVYYFVPVFAACVLFGWAISRASTPSQWGALALLTTYVLARTVVPAIGLSQSFFWRARDPLDEFYFGYFLLGWLGVVPIVARLPRWVLAAVAIGMIVLQWLAVQQPASALRMEQMRLCYTVAVIALLWGASIDFPGMRLLSEATLALYLFQAPLAQFVVRPWFAGAPELVVILASAIVSLALTLALVLAARRILGRERARFWLGA